MHKRDCISTNTKCCLISVSCTFWRQCLQKKINGNHDGSNRNVCNKHSLCNGVDKSIQYGVNMHNKLPVQYRCKLFTALSSLRQSSHSFAYGIGNGVHDAAIKRDEVSTVGMQSVTDNQLQY